MRIQLAEDFQAARAVIKVIGVGGAGGNAINRMATAGLKGVELISANTDAQDLHRSKAEVCIHVGETLTKGLGVGGDPAKGRQAMLESEAQVREILHKTDLVFVTAGMGGGTGTGGAPIVAKAAKDSGALTIGVVSRPFDFEGFHRAAIAEEGIREMRTGVDTLLIIPNQRLLDIIDPNTTSEKAFQKADDVLRNAVQSISNIITIPGQINMDLNDLRAIMENAGEALIGMGEASGPGRALRAAKNAIHSPLLENVVIDGAKGLIVNFTGSRAGLQLTEFDEAMKLIGGAASPDAKIKQGYDYDESLGDSLRVTVIATGFPCRRGRGAYARAEARRADGLGGRLSAPRSLENAGVSSGASAVSSQDLLKPAYLRFKARKLK